MPHLQVKLPRILALRPDPIIRKACLLLCGPWRAGYSGASFTSTARPFAAGGFVCLRMVFCCSCI